MCLSAWDKNKYPYSNLHRNLLNPSRLISILYMQVSHHTFWWVNNEREHLIPLWYDHKTQVKLQRGIFFLLQLQKIRDLTSKKILSLEFNRWNDWCYEIILRSRTKNCVNHVLSMLLHLPLAIRYSARERLTNLHMFEYVTQNTTFKSPQNKSGTIIQWYMYNVLS